MPKCVPKEAFWERSRRDCLSSSSFSFPSLSLYLEAAIFKGHLVMMCLSEWDSIHTAAQSTPHLHTPTHQGPLMPLMKKRSHTVMEQNAEAGEGRFKPPL